MKRKAEVCWTEEDEQIFTHLHELLYPDSEEAPLDYSDYWGFAEDGTKLLHWDESGYWDSKMGFWRTFGRQDRNSEAI